MKRPVTHAAAVRAWATQAKRLAARIRRGRNTAKELDRLYTAAIDLELAATALAIEIDIQVTAHNLMRAEAWK
jgi:hypothetical protein